MLASLDNVNAASLKDWLIIAGGLMGLVLLARQLFMRTPPLEKEFVSRMEFDEFEGRMSADIGSLRAKIETGDDRIITKLTEVKDELNIMGSRRSKTLFEHIDKVITPVNLRLQQLGERITAVEHHPKNHGRH